MAITAGELTTRFPEFSQAEISLIEACIADAEAQIDREFYGTTKADIAVMYLAAHLLATNPLAEMARLSPTDGDGKTMYSRQFDAIKRTIAAGCRVI